MYTDSMPNSAQSDFSKLCVVGLGYVGLPTAAVFASRGLNVVGFDVNANTVALINAGKAHIVEPDLDILVNGAVARANFALRQRPRPPMFSFCVPTVHKRKKPDLPFNQPKTMR